MKGGVVLEADIQGFFDNLVPAHLRSFLDQRVRDGVVRRAIDKWLKAGVLEEGRITHPDTGTPQGGVISPLLANIYLHEVLDKWFEAEVVPRLAGRTVLIRYADDFVIVFSSENDARRVLDVLAKRFAKYGLTLHPEKTRLVPFDRPRGGVANSGTRPGTFDLLGFTHYWGRSFRGWWIIKRQTARSRFSRALKRVGEWCRVNRHRPVAEQQQALNRRLRGHYGYYGITTNHPALRRFREEVQCIWRKWLNRRSQRARMTWQRFHLLLRQYPLLPAQVTHSVYRRRVANC
jgi:group II intron reverse transcriptase/maturase